MTDLAKLVSPKYVERLPVTTQVPAATPTAPIEPMAFCLLELLFISMLAL